MRETRVVIPVLFIASAMLALAVAVSIVPSQAVAASPMNTKMDGVCFYFPDGKKLHLPMVNPPNRSDALGIRASLIETAKDHRDKVMHGERPITGWEDRTILAAMTEQWTEGGQSCKAGYSRSGMKVYNCTCDADGGGCVRVIVQ